MSRVTTPDPKAQLQGVTSEPNDTTAALHAVVAVRTTVPVMSSGSATTASSARGRTNDRG